MGLHCEKKYLIFASIFSIILGAASVIFSFVKFDERGDDFKDQEAYNTYNILLIIMIAIGACLTISGFFGGCGSWRQNSCMLTSFKICNVLLFVVFLVLAIVSAIMLFVVGSEISDSETCYDNFFFGKAGKYDEVAQEMYCTEECPCYLQDESQITKIQIPESGVSEDKEDKHIRNCDAFEKQITGKYPNAAKFMEAVENTFHCAGMCESSPYYLYTDINKDVQEEQSCAEKLADEIDSNFMIYLIICCVMVVFTMINICVRRCYDRSVKDDKNITKYEKTEGYN